MKDNWVKIFADVEFLKVESAKRVLEENQVENYLMDRSDSAYVHLGEIQLFTPQNQAEKAVALLVANGY